MTEKTTGMDVIFTDILRKSSVNIEGRREAMFTLNIDNDDDRSDAVLTNILLLPDTKTAMRVCGKQVFTYEKMGYIAIFPSALFHETVSAQKSTMKLAMFLRLSNKNKSLKE